MNTFILDEHRLKYLNRRLTEIEELKSSLAGGDYDTAVTIGHRLKGNGETFGFSEITTIGMKMEKAAISKDREIVEEAINELQKVVQDQLGKLGGTP